VHKFILLNLLRYFFVVLTINSNKMKSFLTGLLVLCFIEYMANGQESSLSLDSTSAWQDTIVVALDREMELFNSDMPLGMELVFNLEDFIDSKDEPEYFDARLTLGCEQDTFEWDIRIKARGEFRRNQCAFPPIMINVKDVDEGPVEITSQKTMKLVTHCRSGRQYQDYMFREYLIYKLYNLITPYSFNVRLVNINYIDENEPDDIISSYGFLIENLDKLAERNNATVLDEETLQQQDMLPVIMAQLAVFQYMVGNFDWQVATHNVKVIKNLETNDDRAIPVPYDFDFSGFVDASYAIPRINLGITDVKQRRYLGDCTLNDLLPSVLDEFAKYEELFVNTINSFELINERNKKNLLSYINEFYMLLHDDKDNLVLKLQQECILILQLDNPID